MIVVLDTDVSSLIIKHRLPPTLGARIAGALTFVTFVTAGELQRWIELRGDGWGQQRRDVLTSWMQNVVVVPYRSGHDRWRLFAGRHSSAGPT